MYDVLEYYVFVHTYVWGGLLYLVQLTINIGLLIMTLHVATLWAYEHDLGTVSSVCFGVKYLWWLELFLFYRIHLHWWTIILAWRKHHVYSISQHSQLHDQKEYTFNLFIQLACLLACLSFFIFLRNNRNVLLTVY